MKNIKRLVAVVMMSVFTITAAGCNMITKTQEGIDKSAVAKINGDTITRKELDKKMDDYGITKQFKAQYGDNYATDAKAKDALKQQKDQLLDSMITEKLLLQKAKEKNITATDDEVKKAVDEQYQNYRKNYKSDDEWNKALSSAGLTDASLKEKIKTQITKDQIMIKKLQDDMFKSIKIDDKKIEDYYNKNQLNYTEQPNKIHLAHILVKTEDEAKKVADRVKTEDFAKVAKEVSTDPGSKDNGGDLGEVDEANTGFVAEFNTAALALKEGEISAPVKTQYGYHIIKCIKKTEYPVKKLDQVKDEIKQTLLSQEQQTIFNDQVKKWKDSSKITKYEENLM